LRIHFRSGLSIGQEVHAAIDFNSFKRLALLKMDVDCFGNMNNLDDKYYLVRVLPTSLRKLTLAVKEWQRDFHKHLHALSENLYLFADLRHVDITADCRDDAHI
jgi:hypothetical protein